MYYSKFVFWLVFGTYFWCDVSLGSLDPMQSSARPGGGESSANANEDDGDGEGHGNRYRHVHRSEPSITSATKSSYSVLSETISQAVNNENLHETCTNDDVDCLASTSNDPHGLEAIMALHKQLDDDANGNVDLSETGDFLREDLKLNSGYENRQKAFHYNDDMHISVKELWSAWLRSEVHNWTIEQTTEWLTFCVELPQYVPHFIKNKVAGSRLPQLAVNNNNYLSMIGIKDPIHKQKIALKAMDVVLFGPPKDGHHHWKDFTLIVLTIGGGIGLWYAYQQNKKFRRHLTRMNRDMDSLQSAERALENLQKELIQAEEAKKNIVSEKENLEKRLQESDVAGMHHSYSDLEVSQLKQEIDMLRSELQIAEGELKDRCWSAPPALQQWLQLTHEIENKSYVKKRNNAEKQLQQAREACEKLRKKRSSLVGAFVSTHGKSIDDVDRSIVEARTSLNEVTHELQERVHRWKQVEMLVGFNIINNNGLQYLENCLYRSYNGRSGLTLRGRMSSQDELDDETSSLYAPSVSGTGYREMESSGSETSKHEDDNMTTISMQTLPPYASATETRGNNVHFILGGDMQSWSDEGVNKQPPRSVSQTLPSKSSSQAITTTNNNVNSTATSTVAKQQQRPVQPVAQIPRSQSQEVHHTVRDNSETTTGQLPRPIQVRSATVPLPGGLVTTSDSNLDRIAALRNATNNGQQSQTATTIAVMVPNTFTTQLRLNATTLTEQPAVGDAGGSTNILSTATVATTQTAAGSIPEEDVCSTDSSVMDDDVRNNKRKKRKLFTFGRKSTTKNKAE